MEANQKPLSFDERLSNIVDKAQEIKDTLNGLYFSMVPYIHTENSPNFMYNVNSLSKKLTKNIVNKNDTITNEEIDFYENFFVLTISFCFIACPFNDRIFHSIIKLANCVEEPTNEKGDVYNILLSDAEEEYNTIFNKHGLNALFKKHKETAPNPFDYNIFSSRVRNAVYDFLDSEKLSLYSQEENYDEIIKILSLAKVQLKRINSKHHVRGRR